MLGGGPCAVLELSMLLVGVHVGCAMFNYRMQPVNNNRFSLNINRNTQGLAPCGKCVTVFGEMSSSSSSSSSSSLFFGLKLLLTLSLVPFLWVPQVFQSP